MIFAVRKLSLVHDHFLGVDVIGKLARPTGFLQAHPNQTDTGKELGKPHG
jgi:hypothetical protein